MIPSRVRIVEVGPRDGLQNESTTVPVDTKVALIDMLAASGLATIEAGSFVSPALVPQMADSADVLARITRKPGVTYPVLVPNMAGYLRARVAGATAIAVVTAASETFCKRNLNCSIDESLDRCRAIVATASTDGVSVRAYVSCVLGCPFEGAVPAERVVAVAAALDGIGCREVSLGDTIGIGTPIGARRLVSLVAARIPVQHLAVHFHDTRGQALANILACLEEGIAIVDSSVSGLGGCPFAGGATGNVATEDLLYMLDGMGIATGVDLRAVLDAGRRINLALGRAPVSKLGRLG